ncbi:hypothetical protein JXR93_02700 [bacterium]|nr:hypothetical protein [bacterium]
MIEKMGKILIVGPQNIKNKVLDTLQNAGVIQIEPYKGDSYQKEVVDIDISESDKALQAYKIVQKYGEQSEKESKNIFSPKDSEMNIDALINDILKKERRLSLIKEDIQRINQKIDSFLSWGDFSLELLNSIEKKATVIFQFWEVSQKNFANVTENIEYFLTIEEKKGKIKFLTVSNSEIRLDGASEIVFDESISQLNNKQKEIEIEQKEITQFLQNSIVYSSSILNRYKKALDVLNFRKASGEAILALDNMIFAIQGWIPKSQIKIVSELFKDEPIQISEIEIDEKDKVPTLMNNKPYGAIGQDLVEIYDTPGYSDWDPSSWIFFSFTVFFAMIMADGGYGLLLLILMLYLKFKIKKPSAGIKRFINMSIILSVATFVYGVVSGGFFGLDLATDSFAFLKPIKSALSSAQLFDGMNISNMMHVSVLVGMIHITLSLILKVFRQIFSQKDYITPLSNIAWMVAIWSFYAGYAHHINLMMVFYSSLGVVFFTSAGTFRPGKMIFGGLLGVYNGVQFFSDILSYIRIFALSLSGALIAQTFNNMSMQIWDGVPGGFILAPIIFVLGHTLNIMLCLMGGVIHGLRLNFLEWYRWNFDGGGRAFKAFKKFVS